MRRSWAGALVTSCLMHAGLVGAGGWLLSRAFGGEGHLVEVVAGVSQPDRALELPTVNSLTHGPASPAGSAHVSEPRPPPQAAGGAREARPDLSRPGKGGQVEAGVEALNLADRLSAMALNREQATGDRRSQIQRLRTSRRRSSLDDRRATPNPMELAFVVTGSGSLVERRPAANRDPARGLLLGAKPSREGAVRGTAQQSADSQRQQASPRSGGPTGGRPQYAQGVRSGSGKPSLRARVITARPPVKRARAAVPANRRARAEDTVNSSHQVANVVRSLVHAGGIGGPPGQGPGGEAAATLPGRDGQQGVGARAAPAGLGRGAGVAMNNDFGLGRYYGQLLRQVNWQDSFPEWAIAQGKGGLAVVSITLDANGALSTLSIVRPSGIPEFDRNLIDAIRQGAPYGPLPAEAAGSLRVNIAFDATNPVVGREGGGPGGRGHQ